MPACIFPYLYVEIGVLTCLCARIHIPYMLYTIFHVLLCSMLCLCLNLGYVCHAMCYCTSFVPFIAFSCVLAYWFRPDLDPMVFVIVHTPWPTSKGLDHPIFACLCLLACLLLCFMLVLASLDLGFAMLDAFSRFVVVWLHPTPMRHFLGVTIWEASPWCQVAPCIPFPFPLRAMLCLPC